MIEFRILTCPDKSQQSTYRHPGRELTMGSSEADMVVDDPALSAAQLRIFWHGNGFFLENLDPQVEVRLNGKPLGDASPVKERDNINMGRTTVNILSLNTNPLQPPPAFEHPQAAARFVEGSKEKAVLDALDLLGKAEGGASGPKPPTPPGMPPIPRKP
jgi:pSer/pThr/pTyr-binding forkhead associated (FHA) protein